MGATPNTHLAETAGLEVDNGIVVDQTLHASGPDVYAAGDVANAYHPLLERRLRVEHWANALNGGPAAGRSMPGRQVSFDRIPYSQTDQHDLGMEYSGMSGPPVTTGWSTGVTGPSGGSSPSGCSACAWSPA